MEDSQHHIHNDLVLDSTLDLFNYLFEVSSILSILNNSVDNPVDNLSEEVPPIYQESDPHPETSPPSFT